MPSVSVIIPAYRAEKFIVRTVTSLFEQTLTDWEAVIVSDDKSDYQKFLAKNNITDKRLRFGSTGKIGSGPSTARNIALDMAKSSIIATLDADDTFDKRKLAMMVPMAEKHGLAVSNIRVIDNETNAELPNLQYSPQSRLIEYNELLAATTCGHYIIVFKKPKKTIYYTDKVHYCEDLLFLSQLYDHYGKAFYSQHKLSNYYIHKNSLCRTQDLSDFFSNRALLISLLENNTINIKNDYIKTVLISFMQAGKNISKLCKNKAFSHEIYTSELRKHCPFLPSTRNWKTIPPTLS
jgi:glycosyltransferase involved in cell wall biosynthesis